jgi:hypothetical protein
MFPLKKRKTLTYVFGSKTWYNNFHIGVDYEANSIELYAPFDGEVKTAKGDEAGYYIVFKPDHDNVEMRFLHLSKFVNTGRVKQGQLIAITGNTGKSTTPHLHLDISKNKVNLNDIKNYIDPEKYNWNPMTTTFEVLANVNWTTLPLMLDHAKNLIKEWSNNRVLCTFDIQLTNFTNIPLAQFQGVTAPDVSWYRDNITSLAEGHDHSILILPYEQWSGLEHGFMAWADEKKPVRISVSGKEFEDLGGIQAVTKRILHEIAHDFGFLTVRADYVTGVHDFDYNQNNLAGYYQLINYDLLQQRIEARRTIGKEMIIKKQGEGTLYLFGEGKLFPIAADYPTYQSQFGNTPVAELPAGEFAKYQVSTLKLKL